mgnify:CR=1 FL=1
MIAAAYCDDGEYELLLSHSKCVYIIEFMIDNSFLHLILSIYLC